LNKYSHLEDLYGSTAIRQHEHGRSINETAQSSSQVRKQVFHCPSSDYFNVLADLPRNKMFHEKILINTIMLYRCYDKIYSCMIGSWVPGVENERKMCSSPHTAIRWEIQLSFINLLTILTNSDENEFTERNAYLLR